MVRKKVLSTEGKGHYELLAWWALADIPNPVTPKGEFRMSYSTKQCVYYGEVRGAPAGLLAT